METSEIKTKVYVHWRKGKKHTPETKEKIRLAKLGKKLTAEHIEKLRLAKLGKKFSPEHLHNLRLANCGRKFSPETIEKMRLAKLGKKFSPAHIYNLRLANFGRKLSPEAREKIRLAHSGRTCTEPKRAKGPQHCGSIVCELRSSTNVVWYVKNVRHFVRTHPELFNPEDLIMKKYKSGSSNCNAVAGLLSLTAIKRPVGSWKGWTLVSKVEHYDNKGKDLLDRVLVEDNDNITYPGK